MITTRTLLIVSILVLPAVPADSQTCTAVPSGLVSWWPLGGSGADNENVNPAALFGAAFETGVVGHDVFLNGVDAYGRVGASGSLNVGAGPGFTIDMWINPTDITSEHPLAEYNTGSQFQTHFWISVPAPPSGAGGGPGSLYANIVSPNGTYHTVSSAPGLVIPDAWQHVAVTYNKASGNAMLYLNGAVVASQNLGSYTPATTADLYFGFRPADGSGYFEGQLDEIDLFARPLAATEIQSIFAAGKAGKCSSLLLPTSLDFGTQAVGATSGAQTVTLTNQKAVPLRVLSISITGSFSESNTCGLLLAPGKACAIAITFEPAAAGTQIGSLTVVDDTSATAHRASLIGSGM